jgi:hypothetical protein
MESIGKFVNPQTTLMLILPAITTGGLSNFRLGCLRALNGILKGTSAELLSPHLKQLLDCFSERDLIQNENIEVLIQVAQCAITISTKIPPEPSLRLQYFMICVSIASFPGTNKILGWTELQQTIQNALSNHSLFLGININDLYTNHFDEALLVLGQSFSNWTQYSFEPRVLQNLLFNSGSKFMDRIDVLLPILVNCASIDKDFELRERYGL